MSSQKTTAKSSKKPRAPQAQSSIKKTPKQTATRKAKSSASKATASKRTATKKTRTKTKSTATNKKATSVNARKKQPTKRKRPGTKSTAKRTTKAKAGSSKRRTTKKTNKNSPITRLKKTAAFKKLKAKTEWLRRFAAQHLNLKRIAIYAAASFALFAITVVLGVTYYANTLKSPLIAGISQKPTVYQIYGSNHEIIYQNNARRSHVSLKEMAKELPKAVIAIEDKRFYSHFGIDPVGFVRAAYHNFKAGRIVQGGSTLTQQLAKNLYLKSDRTYLRKIKEALISLWLEYKFSKDEILELYLNRVYLGTGTYGVESASQRYFSKPSSNLSISESALLAGLLKAPSQLAPTKNIQKSQDRMRTVLAAMLEQKVISKEQYHSAHRYPANPVYKPKRLNSGYEADWIAELVPGFASHIYADLVVETTIDPHLQKNAEAILKTYLDNTPKYKNVSQGAIVIMDKSGAVKALIGGRDYKKSQFNRATMAKRSPGSTFKPIIYLTALEAGYVPHAIVDDKPVTIDGWAPRNSNRRYSGKMTLSRALSRSINTIPVALMKEIGAKKIIRTARRLGIHSHLPPLPSLPLGTTGISLLELTSSYVPFSNGGRGIIPHVIKQIKTTNGEILYKRRQSDIGQIIEPRLVNQMNGMLRAVLKTGTGKRAYIPHLDVAGKTGTTQDNRDALFVGYSAVYTIGVWVGNDDNSAMRKINGGTLPAKIWKSVMTMAHQNKGRKKLPEWHDKNPITSHISTLLKKDGKQLHKPKIYKKRSIKNRKIIKRKTSSQQKKPKYIKPKTTNPFGLTAL